MSKTVNEKVKDEIIGHSVNLNRLELQMRRDIIKELKVLEKDLIKKLEKSNILNGRPMTRFKQKRLKALLKQTQGTIKTAYDKIRKQLDGDLVKVAGISEAQTVNALNTSIKSEVLSTAMSKQALKAIVSDSLIEGAPSKEWWSRRSVALKDKFSDTVRQGMLAGETTPKVVRNLRGSKALRYKDSVLSGNYRSAEALVRTSIQTVANKARLETYRENDDLIKGIEWSATFDSRTSEICASLDGAQWDLEYNPIGDNSQPFPGMIAHWNCRSTTVAIVKSWKELGAKGKFKEIPKSTKASMDGQVSGKKNYEGWLKGKDKKTQEEVLGVGKRKLWKEGKLGFSDLVSGSGKPLTLEQLHIKLKIK
jgi:SPP1 gp7 family putative phage head morphogenesis protein